MQTKTTRIIFDINTKKMKNERKCILRQEINGESRTRQKYNNRGNTQSKIIYKNLKLDCNFR